MNVASGMFGGLGCHIVDDLPAGVSPRLVAVMCHGFGAPGTDLVPIGHELLRAVPGIATSTRFVFPAAPLSLDSRGMYGGRAWWHIDLEARIRAIERGEIRNLRNEIPEGLAEARALLCSLIDAIVAEWNVPPSRIVLGGFSQGGMIATDAALHLAERPAGLVVLSGTLLCEERWKGLAARRGPLRVLQSHGRQDPILPFVAAEWLCELFMAAGMEVEFIPFNGGHTIPYPAMERVGDMLSELAAD